MLITKGALNFIALQRPEFRNKAKDYIREVKKEYKQIKSYLPPECLSIWDIGSGIGAIDVYLNIHYSGNVDFYLSDGNKTDKQIHYGYKQEGSVYNSFDATDEFLKANKVTNYKLIDAIRGDQIPDIGKQDLILSILSCGFHYPIDFYLAKINELLSQRGVLILDIREYTDGLEKIKKVFPFVEIIREENKSQRICARKEKKRKIPWIRKMRWEAILKRIPHNKKLVGAEIGVLTGETATRILNQRPLVTHIMIDPWETKDRIHDTAYRLTMKRIKFAGNRAIVKKNRSCVAVRDIPDKYLDYCIVSGDNTYKGTMADIKMYMPKIKPGGFICGMNYGVKCTPGVKRAVDAYFRGKRIELDYEDTWFYNLTS